jgi:DNA-binding IclR family transcriptional regulator
MKSNTDASPIAAEAIADERYLVPALMRGFAILQALTGKRREATLSEIADKLGVTRSSAYRLLYTLEHLGYVAHDPRTKTYSLGSQVLHLGYGYLASRDLVEVAMPHLVRLRDRTGWSAHLGELHGREVIYLARVPTRRSIASTVHVGTRLPAHATTMGRVLLSSLANEDVRELYRDNAGPQYNGKWLVRLSELLTQLDVDRANGSVVQSSGHEPGIASIAAPIRDMTGHIVAAINISVVALFTSEAELNGPLKTEVLAAAAAISRDLGLKSAGPLPEGPAERQTA